MAMKEAVGLIETLGLTAAIESADAMVKAANVKLIGYELTKGNGWVTVKVRGDVGAVNAAIAAGSAAASKINKVISTLVLPRPHADLDGIINSPDNICNINNTEIYSSSGEEAFKTIEESYEVGAKDKSVEETSKIEENTIKQEKKDEKILKENKHFPKKQKNKICSLCGDELCPREKGQPHDKCIHIDDIKKEV